MAFSSELGVARLGALELGFIAPPAPPVVVGAGGGSAGGMYVGIHRDHKHYLRLLLDDEELLAILIAKGIL